MDIFNQWKFIKESVKKEFEISDVSFDTWILPLKLYSVKDNIITILVPSEQTEHLQYISKKYKPYFEVVIGELEDKIFKVEFLLEKDITSAKVIISSNHLSEKYTFDAFVVAYCNRFAYAAATAVAEAPGSAYNPIFIYGDVGTGKTHLLNSIAHSVLKKNPHANVLYVTSEDFANEVIESIRKGNPDAIAELREKYRSADVFLIDDIQYILGKATTQEEFIYTFNTLHAAGKQIVISADKPPKDLIYLDERLRSLFGWGLITDIKPPDYDTRLTILRKKVEKEHINVTDEVLEYIANNIKTNIRELEGALTTINASARILKKEISLDFAVEKLSGLISLNNSTKTTPIKIINAVCDNFCITQDDIVSKKKGFDYALPRQTVMYLLRKYTDMSLQEIAYYLKRKDHSSVSNGINRINKKLITDLSFKKKIKDIENEITQF